MVDPNRPLTADETASVLALLRDGRTALLAFGPCGRSYGWQRDHYVLAEWEEGDGSTREIDEAEVRAAIVAQPSAFRRVLHEPIREAFRRAFLADDRAEARALLAHEALAVEPCAAMLRLFFDGPSTPPSAAEQERLAHRLGKLGPDAFRLAVGMAVFERDRTATYRRGVAFLDALDAATGGRGGHRFTRAEWSASADDLHSALADYRQVLADPHWPDAVEVRRAAARAAELLRRLSLARDDEHWFDVDVLLQQTRRLRRPN